MRFIKGSSDIPAPPCRLRVLRMLVALRSCFDQPNAKTQLITACVLDDLSFGMVSTLEWHGQRLQSRN